jgi:hypothetical protein
MQSFISLTKWRLLLTVLPLTAAFLLAKLAFHQLGWQPWKFDSLTGALFGAATFIIAFLLNGTLRDYNASADMPVQIINSIETIQDTNQMMAEARDDYNPQPLKAALSSVLVELVEWLEDNKTVKEVEVALDQLNTHFATILNLGAVPIVNRLQAEQSKIRLLVHRMTGIRDSDFLGPAYALLEIFLIGAIIALLLIGAEQFSENLVVSALLFTSFTYLLLLIRDLDNPFDYNGKSSVDVDLSFLRKTRDNFRI